MDQYLHSPLECNNYRLYNPLSFSHSRYFRIKFNQFRYKFKNNSPYISGDSIASACEYIAYGKNKRDQIDIRKAKSAKSIFIPGEKFEDFLRDYGRFISARTLVCGNSDFNFTKTYELPPSVSLWLCQNNAMPMSDKVRTLPIGIENLRLGRSGLPKYFKRHLDSAIDSKILVPPMSPTNQVRFPTILQSLAIPSLFDVRQTLIAEREYFNLTREFRFVLCCEGNGFENHRIWETLYQGSFPVLFRTPWSQSLDWLGLPILYIDSLDEVSEEMLRQFSYDNSGFRPEECDALWLPFWKRIISQGSL